MLSFLLLATTSGQPLPEDAVARCARLPVGDLAFVPTASMTWRSDGGHVLLAAWADDASRWHVGEHGCTLATGRPWPLTGSFDAPSGVAFELTQRLEEASDATGLDHLTGSTVVVRVRPDGSGLVGTPPTGGGRVHVATGDGLVAISDRAGIAAGGAGAAVRATELPQLVRGLLDGTVTGYAEVDRLRADEHLALAGRDGVRTVSAGRRLEPTELDLAAAATAAADELTHLVELAAAREGDRWLELDRGPGSLVVAAAVAASGVAARFRVRPTDPAARPAATALAERLGVELESALPVPTGGEQLDRRVRTAVARTEAAIAPAVHGGVLGSARTTGGTVVTAVPGGALAPDPGATARRLLTSQAWAELDAAERAWAAGRARAVPEGAPRILLAELERRSSVRVGAAADLAAPATLLDPTATPAVRRLALAAATAGADTTELLVQALHPELLAARTPGGEEPVTPDAHAWRTMAPVLEAHVLGHAREQLAPVLDLDEVAMVVRSGHTPDGDTARALQGALALAVWAGGRDVHAPARTPSSREPAEVEAPETAPTLVTGVTSRSLLELAQLPVPLDATELDALLGVTVDREVRDLVHRLLLAVGATPGHLPADLDRRLSGQATAHLAGAARTLLARRGGTLADPRLALTLPFWRAHVATPRVVLVAERPPDLAARTRAQLPLRDLLGWWVDAMTAAAASGADVRIVDPGDLSPLDEAEATGWDGLEADGDDAPDLVRVVRTVDSIVREVELDAARPLLRTIRTARAAPDTDARDRAAPAEAPLHVVDELWERAVEADRTMVEQRQRADELAARLEQLQGEVDELRGRRGLKAAWAILTGRDT